MNRFSQILKVLGHVALGGSLAALFSQAPSLIPALIPNPLVGAMVGSVVSSIYSAYSIPPNRR